MIDIGTGPCVIGWKVIKQWRLEKKAVISKNSKILHGLGTTKVIGTIDLEVSLHQDVKSTQNFQIVEGLGDVTLLGRTFLSKFASLEVHWKKMIIRINGRMIKGIRLIQGD